MKLGNLTVGGWFLLLAGLTVGAAGSVVFAYAWHPALDPIDPPPPASFSPAEVARGEGLALIGNCAGCHTAEGGKLLAGGRPIPTPFGTVHSTNLTPDPATGIGRWSYAAFRRALGRGVVRDGSLLYPVFPYDHFTRASEADLKSIYAWLMTRTPVATETPANRLQAPYHRRIVVAAWNMLYLRTGPRGADRRRSPEWNRGRELVEGLGHCGSCHTPRDGWSGEVRARAYDGGWAEGWFAPPLKAGSPALQAWTEERLFAYLRTGWSPRHSAAAGPMGEVTRALARAPEPEVRAMAVYLASLMARDAKDETPAIDHREAAERDHAEAASLYAGACAGCHEAGAPMRQQGRPPLSWSTALQAATPHDAVRVLLHGIAPPAGPYGPRMPAFADLLGDRQIGELATYLRARFSDKPPWPDAQLATTLASVRNDR